MYLEIIFGKYKEQTMRQLQLKFGVGKLHRHIYYVAKIQLIRICIASTSFTKVLGGHKLWKFVEEDLLGKWS